TRTFTRPRRTIEERRPLAAHPRRRDALGLGVPRKPWRPLRRDPHRPGRLRLLLSAPRGGGNGRPDRRGKARRARRDGVRLLPWPAGHRELEGGPPRRAGGVSQR